MSTCCSLAYRKALYIFACTRSHKEIAEEMGACPIEKRVLLPLQVPMVYDPIYDPILKLHASFDGQSMFLALMALIHAIFPHDDGP